MTSNFVQPPSCAPHVFPPKPPISTKIMKLPFFRFGENPFGISSQQRPEIVAAAVDVTIITAQEGPVAQIKQDLYAALQGINRGIFGIPSAKKNEIGRLVELLESQNPTPEPTLCLEKVAGVWKLIFTTITILGSKRTKLGLRDFISLGDFFQSILLDEGKAVNVIKFSAKGLNLLSGELAIEASFKITSKSLMNVFRKNFDLLLDIFNPEGWLEITYVDDSLRIGRDDKGNIFILERVE